MALNHDKYHFMTLCFQDQNLNFHFKNVVVKNSAEEKILEITTDNKLNFICHIINICIVAS